MLSRRHFFANRRVIEDLCSDKNFVAQYCTYLEEWPELRIKVNEAASHYIGLTIRWNKVAFILNDGPINICSIEEALKNVSIFGQ